MVFDNAACELVPSAHVHRLCYIGSQPTNQKIPWCTPAVVYIADESCHFYLLNFSRNVSQNLLRMTESLLSSDITGLQPSIASSS